MKRRVNKITDDLQLQIVQEYLSTSITQEELKKKYHFNGNQSIYNWMRKFGFSKPREEQIKIDQAMSKETQRTTLEQELELKVKKLEADLEREQFRTMALNAMIDIAERELKVDIRKKSGAKR
jgi:transposase-like protein